jgi:hypothetical protein
MLLSIPGAPKALFSILQAGLRHQTDNSVRLLPSVHAFLDAFRWLAQDLAEILPQDPPRR